MRWDYGKPEQGDSFEHQTFYQALSGMGHDLIYFDHLSILKEKGRDQMNQMLWDVVRSEGPDMMFCVLFEEELDRALVRRISEETPTVTVNWFCDDHWRFQDFSRLWAPCFNWVITTASPDVAPYEEVGLDNVIRSQWACNTSCYKPAADPLPLEYDVSFVGLAHGNRPDFIDNLRRAGVEVRTWGAGWPAGRISIDDMVRVFNQTRVNLNFANASVTVPEAERGARQLPRLRQGLRKAPGGRWLLSVGRRSIDRLWSPSVAGPRYVTQIKARTFEVPGSGGFLLTQEAPGLSEYLLPGQEVGTFRDPDGLVDAVRHYLAEDGQRRRIAENGYTRVVRDHTYEQRFTEIFHRVGLPQGGG